MLKQLGDQKRIFRTPKHDANLAYIAGYASVGDHGCHGNTI